MPLMPFNGSTPDPVAVQRVDQLFEATLAAKVASRAVLAPAIAVAAERMVAVLRRGGQILCCGNGGSAADAQHFASELVNRFESERRALAAIALTTDSSIITSIANDYCYERIFARQIEALGRAGDLLLAISTSGESASVVAAVEAAAAAGMATIALTGKSGGAVARQLQPTDLELRVPSDSTARIQENHLFIIHALCALIDYHFERAA